MPYGLIGERLGHSYSATLHEWLGDTPYSLISLSEEEFPPFMEKRGFDGLNVTIPYKQKAMAYCDELDETAREIGAVNTLVCQNGKLLGYNTDAAGLKCLLLNLGCEVRGKTALVLGNGGTSHTARYVLRGLGAAEVLVASRNPQNGAIRYEDAALRQDVQLLINTTPVGMYPDNGESPLSLESFPHLEAVADVVYNPLQTALLLEAKHRGLLAAGGLLMLVEQARVSSELFTGQRHAAEVTTDLLAKLQKQLYNLVLIGMPGCGKSSLGRQLAKRTGRRFVDLDRYIKEQQGLSPEEIILQQGEAAFRRIEALAAREVGKETQQVIATGGGAVLRQENVDALRQNGLLIWIDCPAEILPVGKGRPLSCSREALLQMETQRRPVYRATADARMDYHTEFKRNFTRLEAVARKLLAGQPCME